MAAQSEWSHARYAEVAVDAAVGPERTFTYAIPPGMHLFPGQPILVPLLSRRVGGVVFALSDTTEIAGIRAVLEPQHPEAVLAPHQIELARWLSRETRCTLYEAASVMLPPDFRRRFVRYLSLPTVAASPTADADNEVGPHAEGRVLDLLRRRGRAAAGGAAALFGGRGRAYCATADARRAGCRAVGAVAAGG